MKALIYVQHLLGIGHLARVSRIAAALSEAAIDVKNGRCMLSRPS
jgi:predicted glycosyltransferase